MNRGEIWTVAGGVYASTPRPALIVQDDLFSATASVTVAPLTSTHTNASLLRIAIARTSLSGLDHDSDIMIDKLTTVRRINVGSRLGRLTASQLVDVERAVMVFSVSRTEAARWDQTSADRPRQRIDRVVWT